MAELALSSQDDNTTDCIGYDEDDHAEQYEDTQEYEQVQENFKAMSVSSTQPKKEHLYCLMARVATPATPLVASSGIPVLQLPFGGDDGDCGVTLVEDEAGTEFKFSDFMPDTLGHSGSIGNLAAIGDHDRIDVDAADTDTFLHTHTAARGRRIRVLEPRGPRVPRTAAARGRPARARSRRDRAAARAQHEQARQNQFKFD